MEKQILITISREYGTGGHEIAEKIAKDLGIAIYDRQMLDHIADEIGVNPESLQQYDEKARNPFISRKVRGYSNAREDNLVEMQFDFIKKKADEGESFVVVGRCAETVLKNYDGLVRVFITGNENCKIERVMNKYSLSERDAKIKIERHNRNRTVYHNTYSDFKWGDSRHYDICINSSRLGVDGTAKVIEKYIMG